MKAYFSRRYKLSASHRLHSDAFTEAQNIEAYGKCNNPFGHGHNYIVQVTVGGAVDAVTGMVCDMVALDDCVRSQVTERFDHANLNLDPLFCEIVPSTENFCIAIYELLSSALNKGEMVLVRIEETPNNFFEYPAGPLMPGAKGPPQFASRQQNRL